MHYCKLSCEGVINSLLEITASEYLIPVAVLYMWQQQWPGLSGSTLMIVSILPCLFTTQLEELWLLGSPSSMAIVLSFAGNSLLQHIFLTSRNMNARYPIPVICARASVFLSVFNGWWKALSITHSLFSYLLQFTHYLHL